MSEKDFCSTYFSKTRIDVQTRMYIVGIYAVLDNELSEFEIFPYFLAT